MENNSFDLSLNFVKSKNNQIFKYILPKSIFFNLLNKIKQYNYNTELKNKILINKIVYKKLIFNNIIQEFINKLKPYYYKKKLFYINRKLNYKYFLTIIRQICKLYKITFENKIKYSNSKYEIYYLINIPQAIDVCK